MTEDRAQRFRLHRRARDRAVGLLALGVLLLTPPGARIFGMEGTIAGLPYQLVYIFAVWGLLILGAFILTRRLTDEESAAEEPGDADTPP